jgi:hypothetical protein
MVGLVRSSTNLQELGIAPKSLNLVFARVPVTSQHLDGAVCNALRHRGAEKFDSIGIETVTIGGEVEVPSHLIHI